MIEGVLAIINGENIESVEISSKLLEDKAFNR